MKRPVIAAAAVWLLAILLPNELSLPTARAAGPGCPDGDPSVVLLCDEFEDGTFLNHWSVGSRGGAWPSSDFVRCDDGVGFGFKDRCAAWSNDLVFDTFWGFWGYDGVRPFVPAPEFYVRWYQYISDPYVWGSLEDKSVMLHDPTKSITAYVGTSRNHLPTEPHSGPGMPFVANYQDLDLAETEGQYTLMNRFQNQGNDITLQPGRWYLFEWYIRLNTPGMSDGVTRLWIDDAAQAIGEQTLRMHYTDMRWLRSNDLGKQFSVLRLTTYHQRCDGIPNTCPPNGPEILNQSHRWDRIVVSTSPVGPFVPPALSLTSPPSGTVVSGFVPVMASIHDPGIVGVQFQLDGAALGAEDITAPYSVPLDTTTLSAGPHRLTAVARYPSGNTRTSRGITVTVANQVAVTRVEDTSPALAYSATGTWIEGYTDQRDWSGGTVALGYSEGQRATLNFTGSGVTWVGFRGPQTGIANVYLDDALVATVDTYSPTEAARVVLYAANGLVPGPHTLAIAVPTPRAKNPASSDYFVVVDALDVTVAPMTTDTRIEEIDPSVTYTGAWAHRNTVRPWSGSTAALATATGAIAHAALSFSGTAVTWIGFKGPQTGIARVYLDGTLMTTVDTYAPTEELGVALFTAAGLPSSPHTLTIEASGTKHPSSTDPFVIVDAFDVAATAAAPDTTSPTVAITWPSDGATVSATTSVTATAADAVGVAGGRFFVDGVPIGTGDTASPYSIAWDTTSVANGSHTLTATASDAAGNATLSALLTVTVSNATTAPTATRLENTDLSIIYTAGAPASGQPPAWFHGSRSRNWSGGTASFNRSAGARTAVGFTGTSVSWIGFRGFWAGIADVYLDDVFVAEVDLFLPPCTADERLQGCVDEQDGVAVFTAAGLAPGRHTLTVEVTGRKNAAATDNAVVVDTFDVAPASPPSATGTRVEETASSLSYDGGWTHGDSTRAWSGGTAAVSVTTGARATFAFTGTELRWIGLRGPQTGIARVFLDGAFHAQVDLYLPKEVQGVVFAATGLAAGHHTLVIEVSGLRNPSATSSLVVVDALDVRSRLEDRDSSIVYSAGWTQDNMENAWSGTSPSTGSGTAARSAVSGTHAELTFRGTEVRWISSRGPSAGIADVAVDGIVVDRIDLYSTTEEPQAAVFTATGLAAGSHTLRIDVTGLRNAAATGAFVVLDAVDVTLPSPAPPVSRVDQTDPAVAYSAGEWTQGSPNSLFAGRTAAFSTTTGARATFTFTGTSLRWIGQRRRDGGIALVYLDGALVGEIDTFALAQDEFQAAVFSVTGLSADVPHTVTIEVTGGKNPASSGALIVVDAFDVY